MRVEREIIEFLHKEGMEIISFVDISGLTQEQRQGYSRAVIFGKPLPKEYLRRFTDKEYCDKTRFKEIESITDSTGDRLAHLVCDLGYGALSQSEKSLEENGRFSYEDTSSQLPHKTIGVIGGLGWIGKNNLLVTEEYGCAQSICTVLTDAPLQVVKGKEKESKCGGCKVCRDICSYKALSGTTWSREIQRDEIIAIDKCTTCLKCLALCPWTIRYRDRE